MLGELFNTIRSHSTTLTNTASVLIVLAAELLIGSNLFRCPCHASDYRAIVNPDDPLLHRPQSRVYYAAAFIVWPAVASFIMSLAISGTTLRCMTGYKRHCNLGRHCQAVRYLLNNSATAFVPPLAWLVIVFMDGKYYECATSKLPSVCLEAARGAANSTENYIRLTVENDRLRSVSQIIGLTCLGCGITLAGLLVLCGQLFSNLTYYQRRYMQTFRDKEMETFAAVSEEMITEQLTTKWRRFFGAAQPDDWASISGLPDGGPLEVGGGQYYTEFHAWQPDEQDKPGPDVRPLVKPDPHTGLELTEMPCDGAAPNYTNAKWTPLPARHLVGFPVNPEDGATCHGHLTTLFVPIQDGRERKSEGGQDTKDSQTQTVGKEPRQKKEVKRVAFNLNTAFEDGGELTGEKPVKDASSRNPTLKPLMGLPMPAVEVSDIYSHTLPNK